jgi:ATP-binding cassette, subfamily B, bacterial PglK
MINTLKKTFLILKSIDEAGNSGVLKLSLNVLLVSILEVVSIGLLLPYLKIVSDGEASPLYLEYNFFSLNYQLFIFIISFLLIAFFIIKSIMQYFLYREQYDYIFNINKKISLHLAKSYMSMDYRIFTDLNSSVLVKNVTQEVIGFVQGILLPLVVVFIEFFVIIIMTLMLLYINYSLLLIVALLLSPVFLYLYYMIKKHVITAGSEREEAQSGIFRLSEEILSSYKEVYIYNSLSDMLSYLGENLDNYKKSSALFQLYNQLPRIVIEAAVFSLFILIVITTVQLSYSQSEMASLLVFGIALVRMIPSANRINSAFVRIKYYIPSCNIIFDAISQEKKNTVTKPRVGFSEANSVKSIKLGNVSYSYGKDTILNDIDLVINKGDKIAIIGASGSGKSTLVDIISGFLKLTKAATYSINNNTVSYRDYVERVVSNISLVSQDNFFYDDTLRNNIILNDEHKKNINDSEIKELLIDFGLEEFENKLYDSIGQKSIKLSGGQKQRIAIIRALLSQKDILILDEATSALDIATESKVLNYIKDADKTVISITHNIKNLKYYNYIMILSEGKGIEFEAYSKHKNYHEYIA